MHGYFFYLAEKSLKNFIHRKVENWEEKLLTLIFVILVFTPRGLIVSTFTLFVKQVITKNLHFELTQTNY